MKWMLPISMQSLQLPAPPNNWVGMMRFWSRTGIPVSGLLPIPSRS
ncbi:hypothetical protein L915_03810 [Phytophthora nicotianae]|uniref:Uncharacterized protein n=1 Tax=Phytophthora nicotianae TaxID=4792 RepID=W2JIU9_PHYNI|nr:hypothetical protein L915_03810 [Phytophthora nicotianae]ETL46361.1 hypothetical protein L916_03748 [Phytophthora nicotianae]